jgi:hypothetical protein
VREAAGADALGPFISLKLSFRTPPGVDEYQAVKIRPGPDSSPPHGAQATVESAGKGWDLRALSVAEVVLGSASKAVLSGRNAQGSITLMRNLQDLYPEADFLMAER